MRTEDLINLMLDTAILEDIGDGDHSSMACIPKSSIGSVHLLVKDNGIIAGINIAQLVFNKIDPGIKINVIIKDGARVKRGDIVFTASGGVQSILKSERLVLNIMQRMSGIATRTAKYVSKLEGYHTRILSTRKTAPDRTSFDMRTR